MNTEYNRSVIRRTWLDPRPALVLGETPEQIAAMPVRLRVRAVVCPECGAEVGHRCVRESGENRELNHRARGTAFRAAIAAGTLVPVSRFKVRKEWEEQPVQEEPVAEPAKDELAEAVEALRKATSEAEAARQRLIELTNQYGRSAA